MQKLAALIACLFRLRITPIKTIPGIQSQIEQDGALIPGGPLVQALSALATFGAPAFGNWSQTAIPNSLTANTINGNSLVGGIIRRFSPTAAFTDSTDTATNIVNAIPGAVVNQTFPLLIANLGSGANGQTMTLAAGAGVTIAGTATILSNCIRLFLGQVTGSGAVTLTSCFQFGAGANTAL